jgi:hypothetical protein
MRVSPSRASAMSTDAMSPRRRAITPVSSWSTPGPAPARTSTPIRSAIVSLR